MLCKIKAINAFEVYKRLKVSFVPMQRYWISNHRVYGNIQATFNLNNNPPQFVAQPISAFKFLHSCLISANDIVIKSKQKMYILREKKRKGTINFSEN